jgi:serine/threonine-protein kinase
MGEVYRAKDTKLGRDVALKILPASFTNDPERVARFRREAQVLASLNHPHIAQIYGLEDSNGTQFLVLELVDGESLGKRIARGPIPVDEALGIAKQIAEALEAAHEKGIIHRDLKPANIALTNDGQVKVLDFGLAKAVEATASGSNLSMSPTITTPAMMTGVGVILGTAAYMSPEQAKGRPADKRSDIWAFGCVLYEMLTGNRAFEGEDVSDTLATVLKSQPDWTALPAAVPESIRVLLKGCLDKDRRQRVADLSTALFTMRQPAIVGPPIAEHSSLVRPSLWRRALPVAASVLLTTALVSAVWWRFRPAVPDATVTRFTVPLGDGQQFTNPGRLLVGLSPDGTQMVYAANNRLYRRALSELDSHTIPGTEAPTGGAVTNPVFSPNGRWIAFFSGTEGTLNKIAITGGVAVTLCAAANPVGMSWDASGILFGQGGENPGIFRVSENGGKPERLISVAPGEFAHGPQVLPDHETVLFTLADGTGVDRWDKARIVAQSLTSGKRTTLIEGGSDGRYLSSGHLVYAIGGVLYAIPFEARRLRTTGAQVPVVEGVSRSRGGVTGTAHFSIADTGSLIYIRGPVSTSAQQLVVVRVDRKGVMERLALAPAAYEAPRVSPDGKWIAVGIVDDHEANIWVYDLAGTSASRRLTYGGRNRFPLWSADSRRVAFQSDRGGDRGIFWQFADGTGSAERLTKPDPGTSHAPESWSSRGGEMLFRVTKGEIHSLWVLDVASRKTTPFDEVASNMFPNADFSPDGRWVAYSVGEGARFAIYVQPFPTTGAKFQIWPELALHALWSSDGKELFAMSGGGFASVTITTQPTFAFSRPVISARTWGGGGPSSARPIDSMPDGQHFVVTAFANTQPASTAPLIEVVEHFDQELKRLVPVK